LFDKHSPGFLQGGGKFLFETKKMFRTSKSPSNLKISQNMKKLNEKLTELEKSGIMSNIRKIFNFNNLSNPFPKTYTSPLLFQKLPYSKINIFGYLHNCGNNPLLKRFGDIFSIFDRFLKNKTNFFQYGGIASKESRNRAQVELYRSPFPENKKAGNNIIILENKTGGNSVMESMRNIFGSSKISLIPTGNNIFSHLIRENILYFSDALSSIFKESDLAKAIKLARTSNPNFNIELFLKNCREYLIPEFVEGFLKEDFFSLKNIISESLLNSLASTHLKSKGILKNNTMSGKLLDIRDVELISSRISENNDNPIFIISCSCNQISKNNINPEFISYILAIEIRQTLPKIIEFTMHNRGW
jgi:hypothetical protein